MRVVLLFAALWSPLVVAACCPPARVVERPVPVRVSCWPGDPPTPPTTEDDAAWSGYHVRLEAWTAEVTVACRTTRAATPDDEGPAGHYGG